jgi:hypothetical protein
MKTLTIFLAVLALSATMAFAQDVTGFKAPSQLGPTQSSKGFKAPNPHPNLTPQVGGVFADGGKYGTQLINPAAPVSYGIGEKYLAAPSSREDLQHESGRAAHHDAGGIKLVTFEF